MKTKIQLGLTITLLTLVMSARADILELKSGSVLNGKYNGGTAGTVRFETSAGQQVIETSQVIALTFTTPVAAPAAAVPAATPAPAAAPLPATPAPVVTQPPATVVPVPVATQPPPPPPPPTTAKTSG